MPDLDADRRPLLRQRRRGRQLAYLNGFAWAVGNGLASTTLIVYLALKLHAPKVGLSVAMILAMRHIVGVLRWTTPALIGRLADRKTFCLGAFLLSALVLLAIPLAVTPGRFSSPTVSLAALVVLWCLYNLLEYFATIALWSWLGDLAPGRIRGRFLGRRQRWMTLGEAAAMLVGGLFAYYWQDCHAKGEHWIGYAIPATAGAACMVVALFPLARMPRLATSRIVRQGASFRAMLAPLADRRFLPLLVFGCWLSFFNGVTQSPQNVYPERVLHVPLLGLLALQTLMRLGQSGVSPWLGRLADRLGNRPVMIVSLLAAATGPLFFLPAAPERPWWIAGAYLAWVAYAGINIGLYNLMLRLAPGGSNPAYIATYFTLTGLFFAASTLAGGGLLDWLGTWHVRLGPSWTLDAYQYSFVVGWATRSLGALVLLTVAEN